MMDLVYCLSVLAVTIVAVSSQGQDPCANYQTLNERERANRFPTSSGSLLCDRLLSRGWYRFAHGEMPFGTCIPQYYCGTHIPLWVNGTIPMVSDGIVARQACGAVHSGGDCCGASADIHVKNCRTYLVYQLIPTRGCSFAYCAGNHALCANDEVSPTGFAPCQDAYPKLSPNPQLSNPIIDGNDFKFTCTIPYPGSNHDGVFTVTWLLDGQSVSGLPTETLHGSQRVVVIYGNQLQGHVTKTLSCVVKTAFTKSPGRQSPPYNSNGYWIGVKYSSVRMAVDVTRPNMPLSLISTIPIVCKTSGSLNCHVDFSLTTDNDDIMTDKCSVSLGPTDWNPTTHNAMAHVHVTVKQDIVIRSLSHTHIMTTPTGKNTGRIWTFAQVPDVTIEVTDKGGAMCSLTGDPHIVTFDEKSHFYNLYTQGQYYALLVQMHSLRVDIRTWWCGRTVTCICGVVAREGNDVISVDMCHGKIGKTYAKFQIKNPAIFTNKTEIVRDRSRLNYAFNFPSGAYVKVHVGKKMRYMNVYAYVPGSFRDNTKGLCGYFDGNKGNDRTFPDGRVASSTVSQPVAFTNSWSIPKGQSLFERVEPITPSHKSPTTYCNCNAIRAGKCSHKTLDVPTSVLCPGCSPVGPASSHPTPGPHTPTTTPHVISHATTPYPFVPAFVAPTTYPSLPPVPKGSAVTYCNNLLTKTSGARECLRDLHYELADILDMCVTDVTLTGNHDLALSALNVLMESCGFNLLTVPSSHSQPGNQTLVPPPLARVCPGSCNGNGECNGGVCTCEVHFEGTDCSIDTRTPPELTGIDGGRVCDASVQNCFRPVMIGNNFTPHSVCTYVPLAHVNGQLLMTMDSHTVAAEYQSYNHVVCTVQPIISGPKTAVAGYAIRVTGGGQLTSPELTYIIYNGQCMSCDQHSTCIQKPKTCNIYGQCYLPGDVDTADHQGYCEPRISLTAWTRGHPLVTPPRGSSTLPPVIDTTSPPSNVPVIATQTSRVDHWTATTTGCACYYDPSQTDCACCQNYGCPCNRANHHQCSHCLHPETCGSTPRFVG